MGLGQRILGKFGLERRDDIPGIRTINNDERLISSQDSGTYVRTARLADGSILGSFTRTEDGDRVLRVSKSIDDGLTFEDYAEVTRGSGDTDNMFLLEIAPNVVLAAFRNHDKNADGVYTYYRITVSRSEDGGKTWSFASQAYEKSAPNGLWEPFMRLGKDGEVQLTYSEELASDNQCTMMVTSTDQGSSWTAPRNLYGADQKVRDGMNGIAETKDKGRDALVMVFETNPHNTFNIEALISYDDGETWSERQAIYTPAEGHNAGAPQIASLSNGQLAVVFMTDEDLSTINWPTSASVKAVFAGPPVDGKLTWTEPSLASEAISSWPGIMTLDDNRFLAVYDHGGPKGRTISWF
ncbi:hypothetical protein ASPWEDRAFT_167924 [Aspergillus wentii DTO 134E9]|uniref:Sialidase domain-containing protein n=1 Tax=Aspergillus wentii DTO 134E9 TaxID=1073089 RepID=A0A1L9S490_ASPWE|nr:uncharacterized protein ASPWEDRAFT_167924 [Aspergillus wentii DTO 134E9]KAI9930257.1 hypothetical protein MW887_012070 [Aspergillus wentii]OJJ41934.1 hypothetical protein ASPWEDRAFT_167924 [Aspergillus wentii DTO 134E9]